MEGLLWDPKMTEKIEYENCSFILCNFSGADLAGSKFTDCEFVDCNLSLANLNQTALRGAKFTRCKMLGLRFDHCTPFGFSLFFEACQVNHSSFHRLNLKKMRFSNSQIREVDFTGSDLSDSSFDNCDLLDAKFEGTNLERADLTTAYNYVIDPELNRVRKAKFSMSGVVGLLQKYGIQVVA